MKLPGIQGIIRRRMLVNFRVDPEVIQRQLPAKFRPKLHNDSAIAGICLIRLEQIRPIGLPSFIGLSSENAAHRIAVRWQDENGSQQEGVFIPRRDTDSLLNHVAGGRLFPGEHHHADFHVTNSSDRIDFDMKSRDGSVAVQLRGHLAKSLPPTSKFTSLAEASNFFEPGSIGYSATRDQDRLDGIRLKTKTWQVEPLEVEHVHSSFFGDDTKFPKGSVSFDCALLMRNIEHEWHTIPDFRL
jgi:hypothetical protein